MKNTTKIYLNSLLLPLHIFLLFFQLQYSSKIFVSFILNCRLPYSNFLKHFHKLIRSFKFLENIASYTTAIASLWLVMLSVMQVNSSLSKTPPYSNGLTSSLFCFFFVSSLFKFVIFYYYCYLISQLSHMVLCKTRLKSYPKKKQNLKWNCIIISR